MVIAGEPWFCGMDVAKALGYTNPIKAIVDHVDMEDRTTSDVVNIAGLNVTLINAYGLHCLVHFSKDQIIAKGFKRWITSEVLPSVRSCVQDQGNMSAEETLARALIVADGLIKDLKNQIAEQQPDLWNSQIGLCSHPMT